MAKKQKTSVIMPDQNLTSSQRVNQVLDAYGSIADYKNGPSTLIPGNALFVPTGNGTYSAGTNTINETSYLRFLSELILRSKERKSLDVIAVLSDGVPEVVVNPDTVRESASWLLDQTLYFSDFVLRQVLEKDGAYEHTVAAFRNSMVDKRSSVRLSAVEFHGLYLPVVDQSFIFALPKRDLIRKLR